tara:strand:- start:4674 stop:5117 length:444 start_codon:yes stop_codon:yes gene_type:complete
MRIWDFLNEVGSANTHDIIEHLKDVESTRTRKYDGKRESVYVYGKSQGYSFTTNQVTQVLAKNKFFRKIGEEKSDRRTIPEGNTMKVYSRYTSLVPIYEAVSIEEMAVWYEDSTKHRMTTLEQLPKRMADQIEALIPSPVLGKDGGE